LTDDYRVIIRAKERRRRVPLSDVQIWRLEQKGEFPQRFQLTPGGRAVGWYADEVDEWVRRRVRGGGRPVVKPKDKRPVVEDDAATVAV